MLKNLTDKYLDCQEQVAAIEAEMKIAKANLVKAECQIIDAMDVEELTSFKVDGVGTFILNETLFCSVDKKDYEDAKKHFESEGVADDMFRDEINKKRLKEYAIKMLESGKVLPEWLTNYPKRYITARAK